MMGRGLILLSFFLVGNSATWAEVPAVATVNGKPIPRDYFDKKFSENSQFLNLKAPTKKNFLDDLIRRELAIQEAKKLGIDKDPAIIERMETVLYQALIEKKLGGEFEKITVSNDEAQSFYAKNPEIRTSHIFVAVPPGATKQQEQAALERIRKVRDQSLKGDKMTFSEAAQRFSESPEAAMGGDMDYQTKDRLDPTYYETAVRLRKPGSVSDIIRTRFGFHIIKLTAVRPWEEVDKARIKRIAFDERRTSLFETYMGTLRRQSKVAIKPELLGE